MSRPVPGRQPLGNRIVLAVLRSHWHCLFSGSIVQIGLHAHSPPAIGCRKRTSRPRLGSTQRDTELAALAKERSELRQLPEYELDELARIYRDRGLPPDLARQVAVELSGTTCRSRTPRRNWASMRGSRPTRGTRVGVDGGVHRRPLLPLVAIILPLASWRVPVTMVAVALALAVTGAVSAALGGAPRRPAVLRDVGVGLLTMSITFGTGAPVGGIA